MAIKVKNPQKLVVYVGELMCSVAERKSATLALASVITSATTKEISLPPDQLASLKELQACVLALRPESVDDKKTKS